MRSTPSAEKPGSSRIPGTRSSSAVDTTAEWTSTRECADLIEDLQRHGVPVGRINTAASILTDMHFAAREMILWRRTTDGAELPMNGVVPKFSRTPGRVDRTGPVLGADTEAVLTALANVDGHRLEHLRADGVI